MAIWLQLVMRRDDANTLLGPELLAVNLTRKHLRRGGRVNILIVVMLLHLKKRLLGFRVRVA